MKKNFIKPETKAKLQEVANKLYSQHGVDVINWSNFRVLITIESEKLQNSMSYHTIVKYQSYLSKIIMNLDEDAKMEIRKNAYKILEEAKVEEAKVAPEPIKELDFYICVYKDGSVERREPRKKVAQFQELFIGLFDYSDNKVVIRRGFNSGCNIKSINSILNKFGSLGKFETWCNNRLKDVEDKKITPNVDTPRDIETLKYVLSRLEVRKSDNI
jgi:hypothetical protein